MASDGFQFGVWQPQSRERLRDDAIPASGVTLASMRLLVQEYNTSRGIFCRIRAFATASGVSATAYCNEHADCPYRWKHQLESGFHAVYTSGCHSDAPKVVRGHSVVSRKLAKEAACQKPVSATASLLRQGVVPAHLPGVSLLRRARATHLQGVTCTPLEGPVDKVCTWLSFLGSNRFKHKYASFKWEVIQVDAVQRPGTVIFVSPAFFKALQIMVESASSHGKDSKELYMVVDITWKTSYCGWGCLKMAVGAKSTNQKTLLPSTAIVDFAYGRVPKEDLPSIQGCVDTAVQYYEDKGVPLRKMTVNVHFDDCAAGRLTARSLRWRFFRDLRHQLAAVRRHEGNVDLLSDFSVLCFFFMFL